MMDGLGGFLPESIAIPTIVLLVAALLFVILLFGVVIFAAFASKIPYVKEQFIAQLKKRPGMWLHTVTKQMQFYSPKRGGKREERNYLDLAHAVGSYWIPESKTIEHMDRLPVSNYFSKCSVSLTPDQTKAACDFYDFLGKKGIHANEELIDVMVVHGCDIEDVYLPALWSVVEPQLPLKLDNGELTEGEAAQIEAIEKDIYKIDTEINQLKTKKANLYYKMDTIHGYIDTQTGERIETIKSLAAELKRTVVKDGLFVFQQVQDLAMSVAKVNSANTSETIAIANAEAMNNADKGKEPADYMKMAIPFVFVAFIFVVLYKMMTS
ncbi:MAG TPA: hypothetical protein VJ907_03875 [Halanaerobiales bacterium]|nr:hypothetical protein [Halanaerobiales bacterium]